MSFFDSFTCRHASETTVGETPDGDVMRRCNDCGITFTTVQVQALAKRHTAEAQEAERAYFGLDR